ncbi:hypothetical protein [Streptomyces mirabilis]|uniref:hypothetical protein n=1 Tax=Streptomyces mirabilis TaxID=68239 RepID=UPI003F4D357B
MGGAKAAHATAQAKVAKAEGHALSIAGGRRLHRGLAFEIASTNIGITWNYTTWLNIAFLLLAAGLLARF